MKQLIIGQIPGNFNPEKHIALGPFSFLGKEHIYPDFDRLNYTNIINSPVELLELDEKLSFEALRLVGLVAKKYNFDAYNQYSFNFWQTIYYPWLGLFVPFIYRQQLLLQSFINKYSNNELIVELKEIDFEHHFNDDFDFINGVRNGFLTEWIISKMLNAHCPEKWTIIYNGDIVNKTAIKQNNKKESIIENFKRKLLSFLRFKGVYGFNIKDLFIFNILTIIKPKVNIGVRHKINIPEKPLIDWAVDILFLIDKALPRQYKQIPVHKRFITRGKLYNFSNELFYNFKSKLNAAYAGENFNLIIASQHGGHSYGSALSSDFGKYIEFKSDYFITWGWTDYKGYNKKIYLPLPSPLLSKNLNKHSEKKSKIILVGTEMLITQFRFDSSPTESQWLEYRLNKTILIKTLFEYGLKENLYYRPYFQKNGALMDKFYFKEKFSELNILEGKLHKEIRECRLLVLDHPGTTWNMAMAINTPSILYWKRAHFPFNDEANRFLDMFQDLGLYYECPLEAAARIREINAMPDVKDWWNQKEIQDLRFEWMNKYARADKNWLRQWIKVLYKL